MAHLHWLDWLLTGFFLLLFVFIGVRFRGKASGGLAGFFLGGRRLPWYVAGVSMVATTFAADTPLWVTEKIAQHGISGNWLWWNMLIGGLLTTFFFARLWRRAEIITELELLEIRYSGKLAKILRGTRAVYLGLFMNVVIIGWVNAALISILEVFFDLSYPQAFWLCLGGMGLVAIYSSVAGLLGIAITDFVQFILAMTGSIVLAVVVLQVPEVGGISGLKAQLPAWRLDFFPRLGSGGEALAGTFSLGAGAFFSYLTLQWWASWYPGNEPGGGGYISQRMMSVKSEKDAVYASLFFQIAHYALRPWPWIIVALAALVLYPELPLEDSRKGFVLAMRDHLPVGLKGLLLVGFLSAYMSTISTQLNWGSSYLTNDLYRPFIARQEKTARQYVQVGRLITVLLMLLAAFSTAQIQMIDEAATFLIASGAGLGMVLILRWYWWRINAWSELSATLAPLLATAYFRTWGRRHWSADFYAQNGDFIAIVLFTTATWLLVTFLTKPTDRTTLQAFWQRIRPGGWWAPIRPEGEKARGGGGYRLISWLAAVLMVYAALFGLGYALLQESIPALVWGSAFALGLVLLTWAMRREGKGD